MRKWDGGMAYVVDRSGTCKGGALMMKASERRESSEAGKVSEILCQTSGEVTVVP